MKCNTCQTDNPCGMKFCVECGSEMPAAQSANCAPAQSSQPVTAGRTVSELEKGIRPPNKTGFFRKVFGGFGRVLAFPFTGPARLVARLARSKYFQPFSMVGLWSGLLICLLLLVAIGASGGSGPDRNTLVLTALQFGLSIWLLKTWTRERGFLCLIILSVFISVFIAQLGYYERMRHWEYRQDYYAKEVVEWERKRDKHQEYIRKKNSPDIDVRSTVLGSWEPDEPGRKPEEPRPLHLADFLSDEAILAGISGVIVSAVTFAVFRKKLLPS